MSDIIGYLEELSHDYDAGDYVDISAYNYFQMALDEIEWKNTEIDRLQKVVINRNKRIKELEVPK